MNTGVDGRSLRWFRDELIQDYVVTPYCNQAEAEDLIKILWGEESPCSAATASTRAGGSGLVRGLWGTRPATRGSP